MHGLMNNYLLLVEGDGQKNKKEDKRLQKRNQSKEGLFIMRRANRFEKNIKQRITTAAEFDPTIVKCFAYVN